MSAYDPDFDFKPEAQKLLLFMRALADVELAGTDRALYRDRLPCGCRCIIVEVAAGLHDETAFIEVKISPFRLQRCFRHMEMTAEQVRAELLAPLEEVWDA